MAKRKAKRAASKRSGKKKSSRKTRSRPRANAKLPKDAVTLIVLLRAREGQETILEAELRALVAPTRKKKAAFATTYTALGQRPAHSCSTKSGKLAKRTPSTPTLPISSAGTARKDALLAGRDAPFWKQVV